MASNNALQVAKAYVDGMERQDREAVAATLAVNVRHIFPLSPGGDEGLMAVFESKEEVLGYVDAFFAKFRTLTWPNGRWTLASDGTHAILEAKGNAVIEHSGAPYHNTYVQRFDVTDSSTIPRVDLRRDAPRRRRAAVSV